MIDLARVLEREIRDLQRIIDADEAILEIEKSQSKRSVLLNEIGKLEGKIERLRERIKDLSSVD